MEADFEAQVEFLRWAAGADVNSKLWENLATMDIISLAEQHRIVGRTLKRVLACNGKGFSPECVAALQDTFVNILLEHTERRDLLSQLLSLSSVDNECVVIKGTNCFDLTRDPFAIRPSSDIDLIVSDPKMFQMHLKNLGLDHTWMAAAHEEINVNFNGVFIDVHRHFPLFHVACNSPVAPSGDVNDEFSEVIHTANLGISNLPFERILEESIKVGMHSAGSWHCPSAEVGALIMANHMFTDFVRPYSPVMREKPMFRISDVCDVDDLIATEGFSNSKFLELIETYSLKSEMELVGQISQLVMGRSRLADLIADGQNDDEENNFDVFLGFGFQFSVPLSLSEMVVGRFGAAGALRKIPSNTIDLMVGSIVRIKNAQYDVVSYHHGAKFDFSIEIGRPASKNLQLSIEIPASGFDSPYIAVTVGYEHFRIFIDPITGIATIEPSSDIPPIKFYIKNENNSRSVHLEVSLENALDGRTICSILFGDVDVVKMKCGVLVPFDFELT